MKSIRRWGPLLATCALVGCNAGHSFSCQDDEACEGVGPGARCEVNGYCSYEDPECPSERRYGDLAGDALGGQCVPERVAGTGGGTTSGPSTSSEDSLDDGSTTDIPEPPPTDWWDCGWDYRRFLTIVQPEPNEVLQSVPVLVVLDRSRIDPTVMTGDGHDLRFVLNGDSLPFEIELWSPEGLSWVWVLVPEVGPDPVFVEMYYGNFSAPPPQSAGLWDEFVGVWHMDAELADSTQNSALVQAMSNPSDGQVATGQEFVEASSGSLMEPGADLDGLFAAGGTITAMVRTIGTGGDKGLIVGRATNEHGADGWVFQVEGSNRLRFGRGFSPKRSIFNTPNGSITAAWHHVAVVYDDSDQAAMYIDGIPQGLNQGQSPNAGDLPDPDTLPSLNLGGEPGGASQLGGRIDEVRLAKVPRSHAWFATQSASLHDDLVIYGPQVSTPCN